MKDKTVLTPSSVFVIAVATLYLFTALMHPQEASLVIYGLLYIVSIPSAYMLLAIYSMVNMDNVSWGTRETTAAPRATKPAAPPPHTGVNQGATQGDINKQLLQLISKVLIQFWINILGFWDSQCKVCDRS